MGNTEAKSSCKFCTKEIPPGATRCPHCQGDLRSWPARHKVLTGIMAFVLLIIVLASVGNSEPKTASTVTKNDTTASEQAIVVSAYTLSKEYDANTVAADAKYKDKIVEMEGTVDDIGKDITDTPYVTLKGITTSLFGIQCMFSTSDESLLAQLSPGQTITLRGRVDGELIGNVIVRGCKIVE